MPIRLKTNLVIDFHTYLGRDAYNDFYQGAGELLQAMDEHGIDNPCQGSTRLRVLIQIASYLLRGLIHAMGI